MNRRDTVAALLALGAAPLASFAQQQEKVWRMGFLSLASGPDELLEVFRQQLRTLGYIEGRNLLVEYRWAAGNRERLQEHAAELVRLKVDVIVASPTPVALAAKRATSTIPIVIATADPVGAGLVASLARPGGNVTGLTSNATELASRRLQLLHEVVPKATRVAMFAGKGSEPAALSVAETRAAAKKMGITLVRLDLPDAADGLAGAFGLVRNERAQALIVQQNAFTFEHRKQIVDLAMKQRLPAMFESRLAVVAGGLISYGPAQGAIRRRLAHYVDLILKGAKPADLPIEQPTEYSLVVNLKTAAALGLKIPQSVLAQADEVIQ